MTIAEQNRQIIDRLTASLGKREANATARLLLEDVAGISPIDIFAHGERTLEPETVAKLQRMLERIASGVPPQYVVSKARFMGLSFEVEQGVTLIPRPETEGLVDMIFDDYVGIADLKVLDIGTGTGCIAIALARILPFAQVEAWDISSSALEVAERNATNLGTKVLFRQVDALSVIADGNEQFDIIVSNPPYVTESERSAMESRVLDYEPSSALFVPDNDPMRFYRAIADYASASLKKGGRLYFEINPLFAEDFYKILEDRGFYDVAIMRDYVGKERFCRAKLA